MLVKCYCIFSFVYFACEADYMYIYVQNGEFSFILVSEADAVDTFEYNRGVELNFALKQKGNGVVIA